VALDSLRAAAQVAGAFWLLLGSGGADAALALWVMAVAHGLAVLVAMAGPGRPAIALGELLPVWRRHWEIGRWLIGTTLLEWLQGQLLTVVAGSVLGAATVGALRATQHVIGITHLLFEGLQNVVPVGASRALAVSGHAALRGYTARAILGIGLATAAIVLAVVAAPEAWLRLVYGDRLAGWGWLLYWQGAIYLAMIPGLPLAAGLIALERTRPLFLAQLLGAVAAVTLGWPVARAFAVEGLMVLMLAVLLARQLLLAASFLRESAPVPARGT
jgi:O-antigen/teichoic acid export membrane protein